MKRWRGWVWLGLGSGMAAWMALVVGGCGAGGDVGAGDGLGATPGGEQDFAGRAAAEDQREVDKACAVTRRRVQSG